MKEHYDFSSGQRGAVVSPSPHKTRITIRLDTDVVTWFKDQVHNAGGGNYQTLINEALRRHISEAGESLEGMLRRVLREELRRETLSSASAIAEPRQPYDDPES